MDKLTYQYEKSGGLTVSNKLKYIQDSVANGNYPNDIDDQLTGMPSGGNYQYDAIGNLISDAKDSISNIEWTVYGKIKTITKTGGTVINYTYDASGNRISKSVTDSSVTKNTFYVRDASGNTMSVYTSGNTAVNSGNLTQSEIHLYGSSRLGVNNTNLDVQGSVSSAITTFTRGNKFFELSNHLGNVLVTISDKKIPVSSDSLTIDYYNADVVTANDYYPFGMQMPGRKYSQPNGSYRYGFNGKENDNEVKGEGNQQDYGMRIYDPRVGRFLSVDPLTTKYPELTPYQFASNSPITFIDLDGEEGAYRLTDGSLYFHQASDHLRIPIPIGAVRLDNVTGPTRQENLQDLSTALDFTPVVGTIKGAIEGVVGTDLAGNELNVLERFLGVIPYLGKIKKVVTVIKVAKATEKVVQVEKAVKAVSKVENVIVKGEKVASEEKAIVKSGADVTDATKNRVQPRKKTLDKVNEKQPRNANGEMIDPNTKLPLKEGEIDLGHTTGNEWKNRKKMHQEKSSTRKQVLEEENNPDLYQWEDRSSNRGHQFEKKNH